MGICKAFPFPNLSALKMVPGGCGSAAEIFRRGDGHATPGGPDAKSAALMLGDDQGDVVALLVGAEAVDFFHDGG
jgi:hypothetical protein